MEKEIKINAPDGYEIDKENSTFECIKFKPVEKKLPKTWKEYCETHPRRKGESWIDKESRIYTIDKSEYQYRDCIKDMNLLPNEKYTKAILALCQLIQLRDYYNDDWVPNWNDDCSLKYCVEVCCNKIVRSNYSTTSRILNFKTRELCNEFLTNFRDLIEIAKPLL